MRNSTRALSCVCLTILANASVHAGKPYVDRFSTNHRVSQTSLGQPSAAISGGCKGNCPTPSHAKLQLWVPDDANVTINGQTTKQQALGGVHKFSRIYNLHGSSAHGTTECVIQVDRFDLHGNMVRMQRVIWVMAGESHSIRFPEEFVEVMIPQIQAPGLFTAPPVAIESSPAVTSQNQASDPAESKPTLAPSLEDVQAKANEESLPKKKDTVPDPNPSLEREIGARKVPLKD